MKPGYTDLFDRDVYLLDLSVLSHLPALESLGRVRLLVSSELDEVLSSPDSMVRDELVDRLAGLPSPRAIRRPPPVSERSTEPSSEDALLGVPHEVLVRHSVAADVVSSYRRMKDAGRVEVLVATRLSPDIAKALSGFTHEMTNDPALEEAGRHLSRASVITANTGRILQHSADTGIAILMASRETIDRLSGRLAELHLPERADGMVDAKKRFLDCLFGFPGGRATRWFLGVVLAVGGGNPILAGAGLALAFVDP